MKKDLLQYRLIQTQHKTWATLEIVTHSKNMQSQRLMMRCSNGPPLKINIWMSKFQWIPARKDFSLEAVTCLNKPQNLPPFKLILSLPSLTWEVSNIMMDLMMRSESTWDKFMRLSRRDWESLARSNQLKWSIRRTESKWAKMLLMIGMTKDLLKSNKNAK